MRLLIATTNRGKVRELAELLGDLPVELVTLNDVLTEPFEVTEDAPDFQGNAVKKARAAAELTGLLTLADDSGLEVEVLGGAPGVHSARYAGGGGDEANKRKLLEALRGVPEHQRGARFRCVLALIAPGDALPVMVVEGYCYGTIAEAPRGDGGFGYDPLFVVEGRRKTMAELRPEEKNAVSHRGRAVSALAPLLRGYLATAVEAKAPDAS